ncbi:MAG: glucosaminidase domain-containing protein [Alphaproteobacteria bacterium]|nr:glucosaminidase domain-containing protein [Alphaproteobacteria bacterium]
MPMNYNNLRKTLEANRFYYAKMFEAMRPAHEKIHTKQKQIITRFYHKAAQMEARLQAMEAEFGYKYNSKSHKFNPYHDDLGRFTFGPGGGGNADGVTDADRKNPRFQGMTDTQIKKQKFVDAHLAVAEKGAQQLNVPVQNLLGLSALESGWGVGDRFASEGNNFFGLHYPAPFSGSPMYAALSGAPVATFANYEASMNSFIVSDGNIIRGISDPTAFAEALQNSGKFGINRNGTAVSTYVPNMVSTIHGLSSYIARTRNLR